MDETAKAIQKKPILFEETTRYSNAMTELDSKVGIIEGKIDILKGVHSDQKELSTEKPGDILPLPLLVQTNGRFEEANERLQRIINNLIEIVG